VKACDRIVFSLERLAKELLQAKFRGEDYARDEMSSQNSAL
jgi:hypothetical protein